MWLAATCSSPSWKAAWPVSPRLDGAELDGLFVEPRLWRQGVGTALVKAAVHEARRRGLSLVTVVANPTAREFYENCGFAVEGEEADPLRPGAQDVEIDQQL